MAEKIKNQIDVSQYTCQPHSELECHFKWFNELNNKYHGQWLSRLLDKQLHNDFRKAVDSVVAPDFVNEEPLEENDGDDLESNDDKQNMTLHSHRLSMLSWQFTLVLRNTFEKNYVKALEIAKKLLEVEEAKNLSQPQVHIDTYYYVVLSNQLNVLEQWRSSSEHPVDAKEIDEMVSLMEILVRRVDTNEGRAFIANMKSNLSRDMQDLKLRIDFAKQATELNPQFAGWHQSLYWALRQFRRSIDFRQRPSLEEIEACEKAYKLESTTTVGNVVTMGRLYRELLFSCRRGSRDHQEVSEKTVKYAREAVRLRPASKLYKLRLASLLSGRQIYSRDPKEYYAEAEKIVNEVKIGRCSSEMCHLLGKFYGSTSFGQNKSVEALEWFEKGLKANFGNFPCLMDMLRNEEFQRKPTSDIIQKIDNALKSQPKQLYTCQLMFVKGFYVWTIDQNESLDLWLMAMEEAAGLQINFFNMATFNFCFVKDRNHSHALRVMRSIKYFMNGKAREHLEEQSFTKLMDLVDSVITHFDKKTRESRDKDMVKDSWRSKNNGNNGNWRKK